MQAAQSNSVGFKGNLSLYPLVYPAGRKKKKKKIGLLRTRAVQYVPQGKERAGVSRSVKIFRFAGWSWFTRFFVVL